MIPHVNAQPTDVGNLRRVLQRPLRRQIRHPTFIPPIILLLKMRSEGKVGIDTSV